MKNIKILLLASIVIIEGFFLLIGNHENKDNPIRVGHIPGTVLTFPGEVIKYTNLLKDSGLKYEIVEFATSNQGYEALVRGDINVLPTTAFLGIAQNYHKQNDAVKIFAASNYKVEDKIDQVLVKKDSEIKKLSDISGKTLKYGVFPGSTHTTFTKNYLRSKNIDFSKIEFVGIAPNTHLQALEAGSIDVLGTYEPMASIGLESGNFVSIENSIYANSFPDIPLSVGIVNNNFAISNVELLKKFVIAYDRVYQEIISNPEMTKEVLVKAYNLDENTAKLIIVPKGLVNTNFDDAKLQAFADYLVGIKELEKSFNVSTILFRN